MLIASFDGFVGQADAVFRVRTGATVSRSVSSMSVRSYGNVSKRHLGSLASIYWTKVQYHLKRIVNILAETCV